MYCNVNFDCKQCSEVFPKIALLATHMRLKHGAVAGAKTREIFIPVIQNKNDQTSQHKCMLCSNISNSIEDFTNHFIQRHSYDITNLKPAKCSKCSIKFKDVSSFLQHYRLNHLL